MCRYLSLQYPDVLYLSDTIASVKLTKPQAARNKLIQKSGFKCPDLLILEPRNGKSGLMLELKAESPYKKTGELKTSEHLEGQQMTLEQLRRKGYDAKFVWDFEMAMKAIKDYFSNE